MEDLAEGMEWAVAVTAEVTVVEVRVALEVKVAVEARVVKRVEEMAAVRRLSAQDLLRRFQSQSHCPL